VTRYRTLPSRIIQLLGSARIIVNVIIITADFNQKQYLVSEPSTQFATCKNAPLVLFTLDHPAQLGHVLSIGLHRIKI